MQMTFHEYYGNLPKSILTLIRQYNVSPADWDLLTDILGFDAYKGDGVIDWQVIGAHITHNSVNGYYQPRYF